MLAYDPVKCYTECQSGQNCICGGGDLLSALSAQEQAELERLLTVLLEDWKGRMPEKGKDHHYGRR